MKGSSLGELLPRRIQRDRDDARTGVFVGAQVAEVQDRDRGLNDEGLAPHSIEVGEGAMRQST